MRPMATYLKPRGEYQPRRPMATREPNDRWLLWLMVGVLVVGHLVLL